MADLKETTAAGLKVLRAPVDPQDVVRLGDLETTLAPYALSASIPSLHAALTTRDSNSIRHTLSEQDLSSDLILGSSTQTQAAGGPATESFGHPIVEAQTLTLAKQQATVTLVARYDAEETLLATGVADTDYEVDAQTGTLTILAGSNLVTSAGQNVDVTYTYAQIQTGPALQVDAAGLKVNLGTAHHQAAYGDHRHANDHKAATGVTTATAATTVTAGQKVSVNVVLDPAGKLMAGESGIGLDPDASTFAPPTHAWLCDHFIGGGTISGAIGELGWTEIELVQSSAHTLAYSQSVQDSNSVNHHGILTITATTQDAGYGICLGGGVVPLLLSQDNVAEAFHLGFVFKLASHANLHFKLGLFPAMDSMEPENFVGVRLDTGASGDTVFKLVGIGGYSPTNEIAADDAWHYLEIFTSAREGLSQVRLDGTSTLLTTVVNGSPGVLIASLDGNDRTVGLDWSGLYLTSPGITTGGGTSS